MGTTTPSRNRRRKRRGPGGAELRAPGSGSPGPGAGRIWSAYRRNHPGASCSTYEEWLIEPNTQLTVDGVPRTPLEWAAEARPVRDIIIAAGSA